LIKFEYRTAGWIIWEMSSDWHNLSSSSCFNV